VQKLEGSGKPWLQRWHVGERKLVGREKVWSVVVRKEGLSLSVSLYTAALHSRSQRK
jgi:hypothetical protein